MNRNGAVGLIASGVILVIAAPGLLLVDGLQFVAVGVGGIGVVALVAGVLVYRRSPAIAPGRDELVGAVAMGVAFMLIGTLGLLVAPPTLSSVLFTVGGMALLILAVIRYRRAPRIGRGRASDG